MNILITNDDGIHAMGIIALAQRLKIEHKVFVVAPEVERSGSSHSLTLSQPLVVKRVEYSEYDGIEAFSVGGTPADCVILGSRNLVEEKIDLVLSGINLGSNVGTNIAYSGTVNAALEGLICGYPSIALSQTVEHQASPAKFPAYFKTAADLTAKIIRELEVTSLKTHILNINFPAQDSNDIKGIKACEQGVNVYDTAYRKDMDPFGREIYWLLVEKNNETYNEENRTDVKWVREGYITVTPLTWNNSYDLAMKDVKCKIENLKLHF